MKKICIYLFVFLFGILKLHAQEIDSLEKKLSILSVHDTAYVNTLNKLCALLFHQDIEQTKKYADQAFALATAMHYRRGVAYATRSKSFVANRENKFFQQMALATEALKIFESLNDMEGIAIMNNDIGNILIEQQHGDEALPYLKKSLELKKALHDKAGMAKTFNNIGSVYMTLNENDSALIYLKQSVDLKKELNDKRGLAFTYENFAIILNDKKNYQQALNYIKLAQQYYTEYKNQQGIVKMNLLFATVLIQQKKAREAAQYLKKVNADTSLLNGKNEIVYYKLLYKVDSLDGNYRSALFNMNNWHNRERDFFDLEKTKLIEETKQKFENEKRDKENIILKKQKEINDVVIRQQTHTVYAFITVLLLIIIIVILLYKNILQQKKSLAALNIKNQEVHFVNEQITEKNKDLERLHNVKNKLFMLISHDMRSPLVQLDSVLNMLNAGNLEKDEFEIFTADLWKDIKNTTHILDNLLLWAKNQMSGITASPANIHLSNAIAYDIELLRHIAAQKNIQIKIEMPVQTCLYADEEMIRLVIRNLISNAIKFTPKNGQINLTCTALHNNIIEVCISDNGLGISEEDQHRIFSDTHFTSYGTEKEKGSGLGLALCKDFIEKNHGTLYFKSKRGKGTQFYFTIPASSEKLPEISDGFQLN